MTDSKSASEFSGPRRRVLFTWLAMTLIAVLITLSGGDRMRRGVVDGWQIMDPRPRSRPDVRLVLIDNESIALVGPWPWPRYYLARMAEALAKTDVKGMAFDVLLSG